MSETPARSPESGARSPGKPNAGLAPTCPGWLVENGQSQVLRREKSVADRKRSRIRWPKALKNLRSAARNAVDLLRNGRLSAPYQAPFEVLVREPTYCLRRYGAETGRDDAAEPLLLVPPLMVSSEIYDISPELSAVSWLADQGLDVWLVDFGAPEDVGGGLQRTLDDHVLAVSDSIDKIRQLRDRDVHVSGYSQGGMFAYQAAAYRHSRGIASLITFGSPVDMRRMSPVKVHGELAERFLRGARTALGGTINNLEGLPKELTSRGFKLISAGKEVRQLVDFFGMLHNREALEKAEIKRRFLGGEGFVSWPGPALAKFFDQVVVQNRMTTGGFVLDGKPVSLSDITCPVLIFVGERDDIARAPAVRAISKVAMHAPLTEICLPSGHFGLVVGSQAMTVTWPRVVRWVQNGGASDWQHEEPPKPAATQGVLPFYDLASDVLDGLWDRLGDVSLEVGSVLDTLRWQLPRLARLRRLKGRSRVNMGRVLAEQAAAIPDAVFFLWKERAFTYSQADARVNQVLSGLLAWGLQRGRHVGLLMGNHPDLLTLVTAINRLGAVAVLIPEKLRGSALHDALEAGQVDRLLVDAGGAAAAVAQAGGRPLRALARADGALPPGVARLVLPALGTPLPDELVLNPGRAEELALLLFTSGSTGTPKAARITNRRWALAALASAAACRLTSSDTVYCCLPLHHATGLLVACGGALVGGSRLALAAGFSAGNFWPDVRRYGASVVFYVGELCRFLVQQPAQEAENRHPVRLFAGNGLRADVWERLVERFGPLRVLEFYASTEGNVVLANLSGEKPGSVGRAFSTSGRVRLVRFDATSHELCRDAQGTLQRCGVDEPGVLLARIDSDEPLTVFDGYMARDAHEQRIVRDAFEPGDAWFHSGDVLRRDADGDFWFYDRLADCYCFEGQTVSTEQVARVLHALPEVALAAVYSIELPSLAGTVGMASLQLRDAARFDPAACHAWLRGELAPAAHPRCIRILATLPTTRSFKLDKRRLQSEGADPSQIADPLFVLDAAAGSYKPLGPKDYTAWCGSF